MSTALAGGFASLDPSHPTSRAKLKTGCLARNVSRLRPLAPALGATLVATLVGFALTFRRDGKESPQVELKNPFELGSAIKVTAVFAIVLLASRAAIEYVGDTGLYLAAVLGGTTDVDATVVSAAKLSTGTIGADVAVIAICIGIAANTLGKAALAWGVGGSVLGKRVALTAGLIVVAALGSIAAVALL